MPAPHLVLDALGVHGVDTVERVRGGADATIYRIRRGEETLALRILGSTQHEQANNENRFLEHATSHGIAGPTLIATGTVDDCPVSVMTWVEGQTLSARILGNPDPAELPEQFGMWQRRIHALPLPEQTRPSIVWRTALPDDLVAALERVPPRPPSVVHLDYHPMNCMVNGDEIVAVLDWANAGIADPRYDVARTLAILTHAKAPDAEMQPAVAAFTERYLRAYGGDSLPPVFRWWGGITLVWDLQPKVGHPDIPWLTQGWVDSALAWAEEARQETLRDA